MTAALASAEAARFRRVWVGVDGSALSDRAAAIAVDIARSGGGALLAGHAFAASLHDRRFRQMEGGLPEPFQREPELVRQRDVHATLITRGLRLISESYLDQVERLAGPHGLVVERSSVEGTNWSALLADVRARGPDLVVLGARGHGQVAGCAVGSVCERVVRRLDVDALVVRDLEGAPFERVGVATDGSARSLGALRSAMDRVGTGGRLDLVSSFDPEFHHQVFRAIRGVLSEEAGRVFRFEEQEELHERIIDRGLERIYREHLDTAARIASEAGIGVETTMLTGKAAVCLRDFARSQGLTTLFLGRTGVHSMGDLDLGSCPELLLRTPMRCNLFLSARGEDPRRYERHQAPLAWTDEARTRIERVPDFARAMASGAVERRARESGHTVVTSDLIDEVMAACPHARRAR